jgi:hypothetical protein
LGRWQARGKVRAERYEAEERAKNKERRLSSSQWGLM